ncbi:MAG TPA: glycosyltransferase [Sneathiellales bacterium]|nr:glycosyltransferase [Sneathiellales bacterium]
MNESVEEPAPCEISAVVPVYNEEGNIDDLVKDVHDTLTAFGRTFEIIVVDDGSSDATVQRIQAAAETCPELRSVFLARNYGQSTAMQAGFEHAMGDLVVTLDGDLQNDPADIPRLIQALEEGAVDVVSGWRLKRKDGFLRVALSRFANRLISKTTGVRLHDYGCSLKVYRREVLNQITVYGELHRFIPVLLAEVGARTIEIEVNHRPRIRGKSKYNLDRSVRVLLDLMLVVFLRKYIQRPLHVFGGVGLLLAGIGGAATLYLVVLKLFAGAAIGSRPLLLFGLMLSISGLILIVQGLLGELIVRLLHETGNRPQYRVKTPISRPPQPITKRRDDARLSS